VFDRAGSAPERLDAALGVIACQLLSGRSLHDVPPVLDRIAGRSSRAPTPLSEARPELPAELTAPVDRCLAHASEDRPTAEAIAEALARARLPGP
jgi:hypothetical protein